MYFLTINQDFFKHIFLAYPKNESPIRKNDKLK